MTAQPDTIPHITGKNARKKARHRERARDYLHKALLAPLAFGRDEQEQKEQERHVRDRMNRQMMDGYDAHPDGGTITFNVSGAISYYGDPVKRSGETAKDVQRRVTNARALLSLQEKIVRG